MSNELLPCPFCGGVPVLTKHFRSDEYGLMHRCKVVGAIVFEFGDRDRHIAAWNQRAPQPTTESAEQDKRDACRYRWLRHGDNDEIVLCNGPVDTNYWYLLRRQKLDTAIDAAIAAEGSAL